MIPRFQNFPWQSTQQITYSLSHLLHCSISLFLLCVFIVICFIIFSWRCNLYELIKKNQYQGFSLGLIRRFAFSLVQCLRLLHRENIIHCDLKPVRYGIFINYCESITWIITQNVENLYDNCTMNLIYIMEIFVM